METKELGTRVSTRAIVILSVSNEKSEENGIDLTFSGTKGTKCLI